MKYILVSRKGCHLCEEAEQVLEAHGISFEWQDVDANAELKKHYTFRVPVLLEGDQVVLEGKITPERLSKRLGQRKVEHGSDPH